MTETVKQREPRNNGTVWHSKHLKGREMCLAYSVKIDRRNDGAPLAYLIKFHVMNKGYQYVWVNAENLPLVQQLMQCVDLNVLEFGKEYEFPALPQLEVTFHGVYPKLHSIKPNERSNHIVELESHARKHGLIYADYIDILRKHITSPETPDPTAAKAEIDAIVAKKKEKTVPTVIPDTEAAAKIPPPPEPTAEERAKLVDPALKHMISAQRADDAGDLIERIEAAKNADEPEKLDDWFPRDKPQESKPQRNNWPQLIPEKWYPLDIKSAIIVNHPFDTQRACYEAYPNIREQKGVDIQQFIGNHYELVEPHNYTMPNYNARNGLPIPPAEAHWIEVTDQRVMFWTAVNDCGKQYDLWRQLSSSERDQFVHNVIGSRLHDTKLSRAEATKKVIDAINAEFGKKGTPVATPQPTKEQWLEWINKNKLDDKYVISLLNAESMARNAGPVTKFSEWDKGIEGADAVVKADQAKQEPPAELKPVAKLTEAEIRAKYTIKMTRKNKIKEEGKPDRWEVKETEYLVVAGRILMFRLIHREGCIDTELIKVDDKGALFRARVIDGHGAVLGTAHAYATAENSDKFSGRYIEKAETSAIGRALAIAGFGTDQAGDDIDEEEFLSDSPVPQKAA